MAATPPERTPSGPERPLPPEAESALRMYRLGAFLMGGSGRTAWYEADPRGLIRLDPPGYRIPRRLARTLRAGRFEITSDRAFGRVIRACADPRREGGWINQDIIDLFETFHRAGLAHSVEAWIDAPAGAEPEPLLDDPERGRRLVGGLYGLEVGGVLCAESMFSRPDLGGRDASKACLALTIGHGLRRGFVAIDTQMWSEHLAQFGCEPVGREDYRALLRRALALRPGWGPPGAFPTR